MRREQRLRDGMLVVQQARGQRGAQARDREQRGDDDEEAGQRHRQDPDHQVRDEQTPPDAPRPEHDAEDEPDRDDRELDSEEEMRQLREREPRVAGGGPARLAGRDARPGEECGEADE